LARTAATVTIPFYISQLDEADLTIYDFLGREIRRFRIQSTQISDQSTVSWDGCDEQGRSVSAGVYFYRLHAGNKMQTRKMLIVPWSDNRRLKSVYRATLLLCVANKPSRSAAAFYLIILRLSESFHGKAETWPVLKFRYQFDQFYQVFSWTVGTPYFWDCQRRFLWSFFASG